MADLSFLSILTAACRDRSTRVLCACNSCGYTGPESAHCKGAGAYTVLPYCKGAPHSVRIECAAECWRAKTKLSPSFMFRDGTPPIASRPLKMAALEPINSVRVVSRTDRPYGCYHDRVRCVCVLCMCVSGGAYTYLSQSVLTFLCASFRS